MASARCRIVADGRIDLAQVAEDSGRVVAAADLRREAARLERAADLIDAGAVVLP